MDFRLPGSSVHWIFQARILGWAALSHSRASSQPRDQTHVSSISCIDRCILYHRCYLSTGRWIYFQFLINLYFWSYDLLTSKWGLRGWLFQHILEIKWQTCLIFGAKKQLRISSLDSFYPESISLIHWFCKVVVLHILLISYHWMSVFMTTEKWGLVKYESSCILTSWTPIEKSLNALPSIAYSPL